MDDYLKIQSVFLACDRALENLLDIFNEVGNNQIIQHARQNQQINNHAYFCLLFFQLEAHIKEAFANFCQHRQNATEGPDHVAWTKIAQRKPDIVGMAEILLAEKPELITRLKRLYKDRNAIAHEGQVALSFQMTSAMEDIETIAAELELRFAHLEAAP